MKEEHESTRAEGAVEDRTVDATHSQSPGVGVDSTAHNTHTQS